VKYVKSPKKEQKKNSGVGPRKNISPSWR